MKKFSGRYAYSNWQYDSDGGRRAVFVRPTASQPPDLINSCYYNPVPKTWTSYGLVWDLDAHRAEERWKDKEGALDAGLILAHLKEHHGPIAEYIFNITRSTGGKGVALLLAISPLELTSDQEKTVGVADMLQRDILNILNHEGMGADPGALGLKRDLPNWKDRSRSLYTDELLLRRVQKERPPIISKLLAYTRSLPYIGYQRKRDDKSLLHHDQRVENGLALLWQHVSEEGGEAFLKTSELATLTGLSKNFLYKWLKSECPWLHVLHEGKGIGWRLNLFGVDVSTRVCGLLNKNGVTRALSEPSVSPKKPLKRPEEVEVGERNAFVHGAALVLKWAGISQTDAAAAIGVHVSFILEQETSESCRRYRNIVASIYRNRPELFGVKGEVSAPSWLLKPLSPKVAGEYTTELQKGTKYPRGFCPSSFVFEGVVRRVFFCRMGWGVFEIESESGDVRKVVGSLGGGRSSVVVVGDKVGLLGGFWRSRRCQNSGRLVSDFYTTEALVTGFDVKVGLTVLSGVGCSLAVRVYECFGEESFKALSEGRGSEVRGIGPRLSCKLQESLASASEMRGGVW